MEYGLSYFDPGIFNILFAFLSFSSEPKSNLGSLLQSGNI